MILDTSTTSDIKSHSLREFPNECCGLILSHEGNAKSFECKNISDNKRSNFSIDPKDYLEAQKQGEVVAYYHSHTNQNENFSDMDKLFSDSSKLPLILYSFKNNKFSIYG